MSDRPPATERVDAQRSAEEAERLVLRIVQDHADSLLRVARRYSYCADDANDAYQRTMEILLRHAARLEEADAPGWVHTVCRHEALRVRTQRRRLLGAPESALEYDRSLATAGADEGLGAFERMTRSAEALQRLKPDELKALWLQAQGLSYKEIAAACEWTYTKTNRAITEGRRAFLTRYADIEQGEECRRWASTISAMVDGEASFEDVAAARPHLRNCPACRATVRELRGARAPIAAVLGLPVPVAAAGAGEDPGGILARVWELLTGPLHDRLAASAARVQMAVEAAAPAKVAAVAASTAAIAGGGGVAVREAVVHRHPDPPAPARVASATAPMREAAATTPATTPAGPSRSAPARTEFGATTTASAPAREFATTGTREWAATGRTAVATPSGSAGAPASAPSGSGDAPASAVSDPAPGAGSADVRREFAVEFPQDAP